MSELSLSKPAECPTPSPGYIALPTYPLSAVPASLQTPLSSYIPNTNHPISQTVSYLISEFSTAPIDDLLPSLRPTVPTRADICPLHLHRAFGHSIILSEDPQQHLLWYRLKNAIFIKPLPPCLLHHDFYHLHLLQPQSVPSPVILSAIGLLASWLQLVQHPSDLRIAHELFLLPAELDWPAWLTFTRALDPRGTLSTLELGNRYDLGEVLSVRISLKLFFSKLFFPRSSVLGQDGGALRSTQWAKGQTTSFSPHMIGVLIFIFAFFQTTLSAFQVIVGYSGAQQRVLDTSYWFANVVLFICALSLVIIIWRGLLGMFSRARWLKTVSATNSH